MRQNEILDICGMSPFGDKDADVTSYCAFGSEGVNIRCGKKDSKRGICVSCYKAYNNMKMIS